jgi:hypothetical protein
MSWSDKYKRSINCNSPKGFSQRAHCDARTKRAKNEETKSKSPFNEMHKVKSHKSVEQIAKKHRLEVSFVRRQLEMGIPIEHEHTKDKDLATDIALQHLEEIPDYYTRLKKMEADAKKHHKKFKDVNVTEEGLRDWFGKSKSKDKKPGWVDVVDGDACAREEGETATPKCVSSEKRASMSKAERLAARAAKRREDPNQPQKSGASKPTMVKTDRKTRKEEMNLQEVKDKPGKGSGKKDACYHKVKSRYSVWPSAYASGALVKCRKVGAANWGTKSEETTIDEAKKCWKGYKKKGTQTLFGKTYNRCVKANEETQMIRYCPKCKKDETRDECKYGPKYWDTFSMPIKLKDHTPNTPHPGNFPESYDHEHSMARSEISTIISAAKRLKKKMKGEGNIEAWVQSKITKAADYLDSAADYVDSGEMKAESVSNEPKLKPKSGLGGGKPTYLKGKEPRATGAKLPDIRKESISIEDADGNHYADFIDIIKPEPLKPSKGIGSKLLGEQSNELKTFQQFMEDWQKSNRNDGVDGLSQSTVNAYKRENPGSKLQTAVTEKKPKGKRAKRRASFCRRMKGMKSKLTSAKTARDPDSRINKALRRWNCN